MAQVRPEAESAPVSNGYVPYIDQLFPVKVVITRRCVVGQYIPKRCDIVAWCTEQEMVVNDDYHLEAYMEAEQGTGFSSVFHVKFRCKNERHAVMFKLRWG